MSRHVGASMVQNRHRFPPTSTLYNTEYFQTQNAPICHLKTLSLKLISDFKVEIHSESSCLKKLEIIIYIVILMKGMKL